MDNLDYLRFLGALVLVLGLILALTWAIRRFGPHGLGGPGLGKRRLVLIESLTLDAKHRLVLFRKDDREHLVVLGGAGTLIESATVAAAQEGEPG